MADLDPKEAHEQVMKAFEAFKAANDANLKKRDGLLEEQTEKLNKHLNTFEGMNQKVVQALEGQKSMQEQMDKIEKILNRPNRGGAEDPEAEEYGKAFDRCLRRSAENRAPEDISLMNKRKAALVKGDDAGAGYLLAPPDVQKDILKDVIEMSPMRSLATVRIIGVSSYKRPKRTAAAGAARRVGEIETRVNTGDPAYGIIEIDAPEMFARAEISQQMIEDSDYDLQSELRDEFSDQFALKEGQEFISGSGAANQALGILSATGVGEVVSGAATAITGDGMVDLFYGLKTFYARDAMAILNRDTIGKIRKLKDGDGQYLWMPGITGVAPNTILGSTYMEMPDMPNVDAGTYPVAFGSWKRAYTVVDRIALSFQADFTTGADNGLIVYRARKRTGGGVMQAEAFKKLKIAAS